MAVCCAEFPDIFVYRMHIHAVFQHKRRWSSLLQCSERSKPSRKPHSEQLQIHWVFFIIKVRRGSICRSNIPITNHRYNFHHVRSPDGRWCALSGLCKQCPFHIWEPVYRQQHYHWSRLRHIYERGVQQSFLQQHILSILSMQLEPHIPSCLHLSVSLQGSIWGSMRVRRFWF